MCYSPPLLAAFRCRWWLAFLAPLAEGPGRGSPPLLAGFRCRRWCVVCGVWCVACGVRRWRVWWVCGWCVVWLVPPHSWRVFLCATHRHSWLGFAAGGGVRLPATPGWGLPVVVVCFAGGGVLCCVFLWCVWVCAVAVLCCVLRFCGVWVFWWCGVAVRWVCLPGAPLFGLGVCVCAVWPFVLVWVAGRGSRARCGCRACACVCLRCVVGGQGCVILWLVLVVGRRHGSKSRRRGPKKKWTCGEMPRTLYSKTK